MLAAPLAFLRRHAATLGVVAVGLASTAAAYAYVDGVVRRQERGRFDDQVSATTTAVEERMLAYMQTLRATRGYVAERPGDPPADGFALFVASLEMERRYPGIQGIGWARALAPGEVAAHERAMRAAGNTAYRVWPEGPREAYGAIVRLEPRDWRNRRALGFDMYSEPVRRDAMARARDTGEASASGRVELVQEAGVERQAGFLVYLPVFADGVHVPGPAQRRERLRGWVYAPFRAGDLLRSVRAGDSGLVQLEVYDGEEAVQDALLHQSGTRPEEPPAQAERRIEVAGRTWTLRHAARMRLSSPFEQALPPFVAVAGLVLTAFVGALTRREVQARGRAEDAARRASFLAEAGQRLAESLDYRRTLADVVELAAARLPFGCAVEIEEPSGPLWLAGHPDTESARRAARALRGRTPAGDPIHDGPAALRAAGAREALAAPLSARGAPLGMIAFFTFGGGRLRREDAALAKDLAHLAASAVDGARLYAQVEEALRDRDEFLSIASHELRTPLTSLALQSDSLRAAARRAQDEGIARKAEVIRRNVDRLSRLVTSLLDLSRISAGRLELDLETVDLAEVAREVVARFEEEAQRAGVALSLVAPRAVPGRWDRLRLDQVVTNLVSNALKYGGGKPVEVTARAEGPLAVLRVRDRGIGIAPADQPRIFERFERAVSERNYGGFGLGLWITRQIVGALGGEIRVESAPGDGATFTVELAGLASGAREDDGGGEGAATRARGAEGGPAADDEEGARKRLGREDERPPRALSLSPRTADRER